MNKTSVAFKEELIDLFPSVRLHITKERSLNFTLVWSNLQQLFLTQKNRVFIKEALGFTVYI